jgi:hypothetical protein
MLVFCKGTTFPTNSQGKFSHSCFHSFILFKNNGVVSCLPFAPLDTNWRLHSFGLTLLIDKYVDAKVVNKKTLVKRLQAIDTD